MSTMQTFEVLHVTNVSTGAAHVAGTVQAEDYDDAHKRAADVGLAPLFQTYRVRKVARTTEDVTIRVFGQSLTMARCAWLGMLDDMKPDSDNARRIRERVEVS
jgi:hypothetical protein